MLLCHAGGGVGVWDAASRRRERPLSGHAAPGGSGVLCACFSDDGTMGATAARGDRSVALWDLAAPHHAASAPAAPAVRRLALPRGEPLQLRLWCGGGGGGGEEATRAHILVAVSSCGDAFVWRLDASGADAGGGAGAAAQQPMRVALLATHAATTNQAQAQPGAARDGILSADVVADGEAGACVRGVSRGKRRARRVACFFKGTVLFSARLWAGANPPARWGCARNAVPQRNAARSSRAGRGKQGRRAVALIAPLPARSAQSRPLLMATRNCVTHTYARLSSLPGVLTLIVAYGSVARVSLCRAPLPADAATVLLPPSAAAAAAAAAAADGAPPRHRPAPTFGGADNAVDASIPRPAPTRKRPAPPTPEGDEAGGHYDGGGANGGAGGAGGAGAGNGSGDASLGDRLRALELATSGGAPGDGDGRGAAPPLGLGGGGAGGDDAAATAFGAGGALPRADSLALLLSQSLRAGDVALLERVLTVGDARVQRATCRSLPPALAVTLLSCLVSRLGSSPRRAPQLADWLGALLPCHAAHFAAAPGAGPPLAQLFGLIEARAPMHRPLCALHGRLRLLLDASRRGGGGGEGDDDADAPIEYVEGEEEGAAGEEDATKGVADGDDTGGDDDSSSDDEGEEEAGADDADDSEGDTSSSDGEEEP